MKPDSHRCFEEVKDGDRGGAEEPRGTPSAAERSPWSTSLRPQKPGQATFAQLDGSVSASGWRMRTPGQGPGRWEGPVESTRPAQTPEGRSPNKRSQPGPGQGLFLPVQTPTGPEPRGDRGTYLPCRAVSILCFSGRRTPHTQKTEPGSPARSGDARETLGRRWGERPRRGGRRRPGPSAVRSPLASARPLSAAASIAAASRAASPLDREPRHSSWTLPRAGRYVRGALQNQALPDVAPTAAALSGPSRRCGPGICETWWGLLATTRTHPPTPAHWEAQSASPSAGGERAAGCGRVGASSCAASGHTAPAAVRG